jgi:protein MpaA
MFRFVAAKFLSFRPGLWKFSSALLMILCLSLQAAAQSRLTDAQAREVKRDTPSSLSPIKSVTPKYLNLGKTVQGRDITAIIYGSGAKRVLVFGGIHGDEQHTTVLARALAVNINSLNLPPNITLVVVPDVNPDGLMVSKRVNANGVDINRNFPSKTWRAEYTDQKHYPGVKPSSEPETRAVLSLLESYPPHLVITLHAALGCVNWDGLPGAALAQTLSSVNGYPLCATLGYDTPGSLGILTGIDRQVPTVTIELRAKGATALVNENLPALLALLKQFAAK